MKITEISLQQTEMAVEAAVPTDPLAQCLLQGLYLFDDLQNQTTKMPSLAAKISLIARHVVLKHNAADCTCLRGESKANPTYGQLCSFIQ
jgi:hypothetical protein